MTNAATFLDERLGRPHHLQQRSIDALDLKNRRREPLPWYDFAWHRVAPSRQSTTAA